MSIVAGTILIVAWKKKHFKFLEDSLSKRWKIFPTNILDALDKSLFTTILELINQNSLKEIKVFDLTNKINLL